MELIRVLHVVTKMDAAGIESLLMNFYRNIDRTRIQFDFLTHRNEKGFYDDEILSLGGRIYSVPPINPFRHQAYLRALKTFFGEHKEYAIVHSHINTYSMYPLRAAMEADVPVRIAHSHIANVPLDLKTLFRIYTKSRLMTYSTHNFACSEEAGKWLYGADVITKDNFNVVNNSINASIFTTHEKVEKRVKSKMSLSGKFVIGHIGRFNKQKNHKFLIDVFKAVHDKAPNAVLLLIGDGKLRQEIDKRATDLGLKDNIIFTGVRSDVSELLQAMDVFVFPSLYEGLGIVAVEAQAAGLRCVVADTVPDEAFITDLIEKIPLSKGPEAWAQVILRYVKHKKRDTLKEITAAGFDMAEQTKVLGEFYQKAYVQQ